MGLGRTEVILCLIGRMVKLHQTGHTAARIYTTFNAFITYKHHTHTPLALYPLDDGNVKSVTIVTFVNRLVLDQTSDQAPIF